MMLEMVQFDPDHDGKAWCDQCERRVKKAAAEACTSRFCKLNPGPRFLEQPPPPAPPPGRDGLNARQQVVLEEMFRRADENGIVRASYGDLCAVARTTASGVAPVIDALIAKGCLLMLRRPLGRSKTTYQLTTKVTGTTAPKKDAEKNSAVRFSG